MRPLAEINREARRILYRELGVADTIRFFGQFDMGSGNYATDRDEWQSGLSVEQIVKRIEEQRHGESRSE